MEQTERIRYYEEILNEGILVTGEVRRREAAFSEYAEPEMELLRESFLKMQPRIRELSAYYGSEVWRQDLADDEAGELPADLARGVLSEDGIYNLLCENDVLMERLFGKVSAEEGGLAGKLGITPGITAVIGSGGKTSLLRRLAGELEGRVLLVTTTNMQPLTEFPMVIAPEGVLKTTVPFYNSGVVCAGTWDIKNGKPTGKLAGLPDDLRDLMGIADYILVEADGSKRLPIKAHKPWEPVIPEGAGLTICVVGASGLWRPIGEVCHRADVFCEITGASREDAAAPELVGEVIRKEGYTDVIYLSQVNVLKEHGVQETAAALGRSAGTKCVY